LRTEFFSVSIAERVVGLAGRERNEEANMTRRHNMATVGILEFKRRRF
jgi:hypothetical protein